MKSICVFTASRSEYGLLKWIMKAIADSEKLELRLIVTGAHLISKQGYTLDEIIADGFKPDAIIDAGLDASGDVEIARYMGRLGEKCAEALSKLSPDYFLVLGDRYELLPACNAAYMLRIPIIHLSGGDVTEGALDNGIRNAVTMLATYHFPGVRESAENIKRMRGSEDNIWTVGEPGLDAFNKNALMTRKELSDDLGINAEKKWALLTFHPETYKSIDYNLKVLRSIFEVLDAKEDCIVVATYANADEGGEQINIELERHAKSNCEKYRVLPSLGQRRYISFMKEATLVIGNSSSGIVEAPCVGVPVVNIGDRQKGRYLCSNVLSCTGEKDKIAFAVEKALAEEVDKSDLKYWGDGRCAERVIEILEREL